MTKNEVLDFRVTTKEKEQIEKLAMKYQLTVSETLRIILYDHLDIEKPLRDYKTKMAFQKLQERHNEQ